MIERLLFNRIDTETRAAAIGGQHHFTVTILAHETESAIAWFERALTWTYIADDSLGILGGMPPPAPLCTILAKRTSRRSGYNVRHCIDLM